MQIILIFLAALFIRLIKIQDFLFFGFEQGRDALIIQSLSKFQDFVLVGPSTNVGGIFHGPWYFYLMVIPFWLGKGNPLTSVAFLIILNSFLPVVMYFLGKDIFKSKVWGIIIATLTIFSYEYILYSRWLSNVSPAPLFIGLSFLMLWKFVNSKKQKFFVLFAAFAIIASVFELILLPQFCFLFLLLLIFKQLKGLQIKTFLLSVLVSIFFFSPLIIFDFRNQHIIFNSIWNLGAESSGGNIYGSLVIYLKQAYAHFVFALFNIHFWIIQVLVMLLMIFGVGLGFSKKTEKKIMILLFFWILMSLPLIFISPGDPQHYLALGLGWILILGFSIKNIWETKKYKYLSLIFIPIFIISAVLTVYSLVSNKDVFYTTIQDDLNLKDQRAVLDFMENDSKGASYRLVSFTIPSLQPQGWDYLHTYYYPQNKSENYKIIYIVIEKNVYDVWGKKWIEELGPTTLSFEKTFGKLRLQKRIVKNENTSK